MTDKSLWKFLFMALTRSGSHMTSMARFANTLAWVKVWLCALGSPEIQHEFLAFFESEYNKVKFVLL